RKLPEGWGNPALRVDAHYLVVNSSRQLNRIRNSADDSRAVAPSLFFGQPKGCDQTRTQVNHFGWSLTEIGRAVRKADGTYWEADFSQIESDYYEVAPGSQITASELIETLESVYAWAQTDIRREDQA